MSIAVVVKSLAPYQARVQMLMPMLTVPIMVYEEPQEFQVLPMQGDQYHQIEGMYMTPQPTLDHQCFSA